MTGFQHYEELKSIFARLDKVLPGGGRLAVECNEEEQGWGWRNTVIEAKHVGLHRLVFDRTGCEAWRFKGEIPSKHQASPGRRWYTTERTQVSTELLAVSTGEALDSLPPGTSLWHASETARRLVVLAKHDAKLLFDTQVRECSLPADDEWRTKGTFTLFATPGPQELCFRDSVRLLQPSAPYLARLVHEYGRSIAWMYGVGLNDFAELCRLHITWHSPGTGSAMRLMPASPCRFENGPIVRVGVGRPVITHDLAPALQDPCMGRGELPVRLAVPEGVMVCADGACRMRYSHGYPRQWGEGGKSWFTLTFFLDCTRGSVATGYDRETRAVIMSTPVQKDRVVSGNQLESPAAASRGAGLGLDLMDVLVKSMRLRLRVAESHLLACRHDSVGRTSNGMEANSSSRISRE